MASNNFLQWNPAATNQETDAAYLADSQRASGASDPSIFDAALANKLFYQLSTGMTALTQMMAYKGFPMSDVSLSALAAQLANILTTADLRGYAGLQTVPYASNVVLNAGQYLKWQIALNGNMTISASGLHPGDLLVVVFVNNSVGSYTVTWNTPFVNAVQPSATGSATSVYMFEVKLDGTACPLGPMMSSGGVVNTTLRGGTIDAAPIGLSTPAAANFTDVRLSTCVASSQMQAPTVATADNSTNAATTAWTALWAKVGLSMSLGSNGYIKLPTWLGAVMVQWGTTGTLPSNSTVAESFNGGGFPTACWSIVGVDSGPRVVSGLAQAVAIAPSSRTGFNVLINGSGETVTWIAVGN
jgi:hypothetical protein